MGRSPDIANLFRAFGGDPHRYREFDAAQPAPQVEASSAPVPDAPEPTPTGMAEVVEEPAVPVTAAAPITTGGEPLPSLSQELAHLQAVRQGRAAVSALDQALSQVQSFDLPVLAVVSAKGGTGKTTTAAGLALALSRLGQAVLLVELDGQDSLPALLTLSAPAGPVQQPLATWLALDERLRLLPFGTLEAPASLAFEQDLAADACWLQRRLAALQLPTDTLVILDCPTGSTPLSRQALALAQQVLSVTTADSAGYASLPRLERLLQTCAPMARQRHLLNRIDPARPLTQDIASVIVRAWGERPLDLLPESTALEQGLALGQGLLPLEDGWSQALNELAASLLDELSCAPLQQARR